MNILTFSVAIDEGSGNWVGSVTLATLAEYLAVKIGDPIVLSISGETYTLVVNSKNRRKEGVGEITYRIGGISPSAKYAFPIATPITKVWLVPTSASTIAKEVIPDIVWNAFDWVIPPLMFSASQAAPISLVENLAAIIGAKVNCSRAGILSVDPAYKVRPAQYNTATPAHVFTDTINIFSLSEQGKLNRKANSIRLTNRGMGFSDSISFVKDPNSADSGELRVRLKPNRTNFVIRHTQNTNVNWVLAKGVVRTETISNEVIPFLNGVGMASKPIASIKSYTWLSDFLGVMSTSASNPNGLEGSLVGTSLARVTYTSTFIGYRVKGYIGDANLFYVENV